MTVDQFKYVIEIAKAGSINRAANSLFISQSVLSTSVKRLEEEIGRTIFVRTNKGIQLTPFGQEFLTCIIPINMQMDQLNHMLTHTSQNYSVSLSLASPGYYFLCDIIAALYHKYRTIGIRINSYESSIDEIKNYVHNQIVDIGIMRRWSCYRNASEKQLKALKIQFYPIASLSVGVTVGPQNPLFHFEGTHITPDMLEKYPAVMYRYMDDGPYSDIYDKLKLPSAPNRLVALSRATVYEMLGLTDAYYLNSLYHKDPREIRTHNLPYPQRTLLLADCEIKSDIGWIALASHNLSQIAAEAIEMITDYITNFAYT